MEEVQEPKKEDEEDSSAEALAKAEEYLDGWKRAKAELINYKKDELKRFEEIAKFANEGMIFDLLAVLDSFALAAMSPPIIPSEAGGGIEESHRVDDRGQLLIQSQLEDVLKKQGLEKLAVAIGDQFDPAIHEAVATVETDGESDRIMEIVGAGYRLNGKLIRPARVKVTK